MPQLNMPPDQARALLAEARGQLSLLRPRVETMNRCLGVLNGSLEQVKGKSFIKDPAIAGIYTALLALVEVQLIQLTAARDEGMGEVQKYEQAEAQLSQHLDSKILTPFGSAR